MVHDEAELGRTTECIAQAAELYAGLCDLQLVPMLSYDILDSGVHVAVYGNGTQIAGNMNDQPVQWQGETLAPWGYIIRKA